MPKDLFSKQASGYARYRPTYPRELYSFILSYCQSFTHAWDCATGNGQVASVLKDHFAQVTATDISKKQLSNAMQAPNINYLIAEAESTPFQKESFDLITVGQALHWFDISRFFQEVSRVLKPDGVLAFWGYGHFQIKEAFNQEIDFFKTRLEPYWDEQRQLVDSHYESIRSPFKEINLPKLSITRKMTLSELCNYLGTWSSVQHYKDRHGNNPVDELQHKLAKHWNDDQRKVVEHPLFGKLCLNQR